MIDGELLAPLPSCRRRSGRRTGRIADRLFLIAQAGARLSLIADDSTLDRLVLPEHDALEVRVERRQRLGIVLAETIFGGMRAMVAITASISLAVMVFLRLAGNGTSICIAPTSSITSIALSGSLRSLM